MSVYSDGVTGTVPTSVPERWDFGSTFTALVLYCTVANVNWIVLTVQVYCISIPNMQQGGTNKLVPRVALRLAPRVAPRLVPRLAPRLVLTTEREVYEGSFSEVAACITHVCEEVQGWIQR